MTNKGILDAKGRIQVFPRRFGADETYWSGSRYRYDQEKKNLRDWLLVLIFVLSRLKSFSKTDATGSPALDRIPETERAVGVAERTLDAAAACLGGFALPAISVNFDPTAPAAAGGGGGVRPDDERLSKVPRPTRFRDRRWAAAA